MSYFTNFDQWKERKVQIPFGSRVVCLSYELVNLGLLLWYSPGDHGTLTI